MENPTRILAVDDSVTIRKALELILVPAGFKVEFAVNGAEAIDKAKQFQPAVVLLDFILPDMRGTEVCRELLAEPETRHLPVVLISARGAEIRQAYHDVDNVVDYLTKPFTPEAVLGVIREVLAAQPVQPAEAPPLPAAAAPVAAPQDSAPADIDAEAEVEELEAEAPAAAPVAVAAAAPPPEPRAASAPAPLQAVPPAPTARDGLEAMFETLRAGLEGVYVEEMDTPRGAGADPTHSYTELVSRLSQQLGETLEQAESRQRFRLYGDGSVRSLDESLLETYRRVCRLLFRAVASGAVGEAATRERPRVLIVSPRDGDSHDLLAGLARDPGEAHAFHVASDYRQLPMLVRLYAPTHLVVDAGRGGAIWEQLKTLRSLPEARRTQILAISHGEARESAAFADLGADAVLEAGPGLQEAIRRRLSPALSATPHADTDESPAPLAASM